MSSSTIREEQDKTRLEIGSNKTVRENPTSSKLTDNLSEFRGYSILKQLPSSSTEADIFVLMKDNMMNTGKSTKSGIIWKSVMFSS